MSVNDSSFSTLIEANAVPASGRWYPTPVSVYKDSFNLDMSIEKSEALRSNLAYSMQYLEFLEKEIEELKLS